MEKRRSSCSHLDEKRISSGLGNAATFLLDQGRETGEGRQTRLGLAGAGGLAEESNVFIVRLAESDGGHEAVRVGRSGCRARVG